MEVKGRAALVDSIPDSKEASLVHPTEYELFDTHTVLNPLKRYHRQKGIKHFDATV